MNAVLTGPTATCGVHAVLGEGNESLGLGSVLEPYTPKQDHPVEDPALTTSLHLETFHQRLARQRPELVITPVDEDKVEARLTLEIPDDVPGTTRLWLATVPGQDRGLAAEQTWEIAPVNVTPYLAVETIAGEGPARVTRRCVLMMRLVGDPLDRRRAALAQILSSARSVLRYLALLLGMDPLRAGPLAAEENGAVTERLQGQDESSGLHSEPALVLFEPLLRAASRGPKDLASVARQVNELRQMPGADQVIPEEFLQMWDAVLQVVLTERQP